MSKTKKSNKNISLLTYRNEADRCYGLAGMAISLATLDAFDRVALATIDTTGPMVEFTGEFYYSGSPSVSPKATWERLMENYRLTSTLAIGNILARCIARDGGTDPTDMLAELIPTLRTEGKEVCQLEDDELDRFIENVLMHANRLFGNSRLRPLLTQLARNIRSQRTYSGRSLAEELHLLHII